MPESDAWSVIKYPNLSKGADRVGGQLRGDKEWLFSGVTKSGRVWRKVPESDARSVPPGMVSSCAVLDLHVVVFEVIIFCL